MEAPGDQSEQCPQMRLGWKGKNRDFWNCHQNISFNCRKYGPRYY